MHVATSSLKNGRANGPDRIPNELIKYLIVQFMNIMLESSIVVSRHILSQFPLERLL